MSVETLVKNPDEHPILNDPWREPAEHWHWDPTKRRLTPEHQSSRRPSRPGYALGLDPAKVNENDEPYATINKIRAYVGQWRKSGFPGTPARKLLSTWHNIATEGSDKTRAFFCQREAVETLTWLFNENPINENVGKVWQHLETINEQWNDGLRRVAIKMATGTGKTRAMAMFRAVLETMHPDGCHILVIAPNLTVTDRLGELEELRSDLAFVPTSHRHNRSATLTIKNYHKFNCQERRFDSFGKSLTALQKKFLKVDPRVEEPSEMLRRVLGEDDGLPLYVFQDEGHHCRRDQVKRGALASEELADVKQWYTTLLALRNDRNLQGVIDFSATPSYLDSQRNLKTPLFPWCITDYCVEDAQEAGICKIARLPYKPGDIEQDGRLTHIYDFCRGKGYEAKWENEPPQEVKDVFKLLEEDWKATRLPEYQKANRTPAIIAVVNLVSNARLLYQWLAGTKDKGKWIPGQFEVFSNIDRKTNEPLPIERLPTLLVHSKITDPEVSDRDEKLVLDEQLELRAPEKTRIEASDIIRGIFQSVGKRGDPGEHVRCVISVGMLSEGWDAKTVTHVFGYRAFGSALLCEQVIGRALRRPHLDEPKRAEYAEVFGVPYPGLRGSEVTPRPPKPLYDVNSVAEQAQFRLNWPMVERLAIEPGSGVRFHLIAAHVEKYDLKLPKAIEVVMRPIEGAGEHKLLSTAALDARDQKILFQLAKRICDRCEEIPSKSELVEHRRRGILFIDALNATIDWCNNPNIRISSLSSLSDDTLQDVVVARIIAACEFGEGEGPRTIPIWDNRHDRTEPTFRDTSSVTFQTSLENRYPEFGSSCRKSEINVAACHSRSEARIAEWLDKSSLVRKWVRNFRLQWHIPWWDNKKLQWRVYEPDFLVELETPSLQYVVIEMKGVESSDSEQKAHAAQKWCQVMSGKNDEQAAGSWSYVLVTNPEQVEMELTNFVKK